MLLGLLLPLPLDVLPCSLPTQLLAYYSENSGFGKPSALLLYHLARNIGQDKTMSLW